MGNHVFNKENGKVNSPFVECHGEGGDFLNIKDVSSVGLAYKFGYKKVEKRS